MTDNKNKNLIFIPIIVSILLALYLTLTTNGPLSWDVYTHINYALAYMMNGITTVDPLLNAPTGKTIGYAPLFHFILIGLSKCVGSNLLLAAEILQPILACISTVIVIYVSNKFYDRLSAAASGMLLLSSFMFTRLILPIPETIAVIFFTLAIYFYYIAIDKEKYSYIFYSVIMTLLILSVHFSTFVYVTLIVTVLSAIYLLVSRKTQVIKSYLLWIIPLIALLALGFIFLSMISPDKASSLFGGVMSIISNPLSLFMGQKAMGLERYIKCVGILPLIFGIIGLYYSIKNKKHMFICIWALVAFIITNLHWIGIPVYTYRLLIYFVVPASILGGYGFTQLLDELSTRYKNTTSILITAFIILTVISACLSLTDESVKYSSVTTEQSTFHIAPPLGEEQEVIDYFKSQNATNKSVLTNNLFFGMIISSNKAIPLHYSFDIYASPSSRKASYSYLEDENIGYIVYDKSLVLNNKTEYTPLDVVYVEADYYPVYYFTNKITENNFNSIQVSGTTKVFENNKFIVCKVE